MRRHQRFPPGRPIACALIPTCRCAGPVPRKRLTAVKPAPTVSLSALDRKGRQPMTTYAIHAQALTHAEGGWGGSVQVPMFYLDSRVQGIVSAEHAAEVARGVIDPLGQLPEADLKVTAYQ